MYSPENAMPRLGERLHLRKVRADEEQADESAAAEAAMGARLKRRRPRP
jgi:hypothetical protein